MTRDRRAARRLGLWGELAALWLLRLKGFAIVAQGASFGRGTGAGEIDLIARRRGLLVFVEVKARPSLGEAAAAVSARQQARIARAAQAFLARRPDLGGLDLRFDAVLVSPWSWPKHVADAWRMDA